VVNRRVLMAGGVALGGAALSRGQLAARGQGATPVADPAGAILATAESAMAEMDLRAVLLRVSIDGDVIAQEAFGESMTGVPATIDMHFRNGAVAITYVATVLLRLVDDGLLGLDDTIDRWLPDLPEAGLVTLRMLANMTAGYRDYVQSEAFQVAVYEDPFQPWSTDEQIALSLASPRLFAPGENWEYSHTNYVILGLALEGATGEPLEALIRRIVLEPLGLTGTASEQSAWMPEPVLHAFSSERRQPLGVPPGKRFYEESTFWNPSWTISRGAIQYTTITDMATSFEAIARGDLLSEPSHQELVSRALLGFGEPIDGCGSCHTLDEAYIYGLGIVHTGGWLKQNPLFSGYGGVVGYHPGKKICIAVETTFGEGSFDETGAYRYGNASQTIFNRIGALLVPTDPPPGS
jgi:CubicO group peptidase (beta-lactamase class C family)